MPDTRLFKIRRMSLREGVTFSVAAAAVLAVTTSAAISVADETPTARATIVAQQDPSAAVATQNPQAEQAAPAPEAAPPAPEPAAPAPAPAPAPVVEPVAFQTALAYENNLDGWIRESLDIMAANGIPGSYDGIYRNVMRESSGNPNAINLWDSNAAAGIPSKGLLQVIDPTFAAYHVAGTPYDIWNPVSNIVAACNYAAHRYGSMDNVYGAY